MISPACQCSAVRYQVPASPRLRMICHCGICRRFNRAEHADILVYRLAEVSVPQDGAVVFSTYRPPPHVQRGRCARCGQAALELFRSRWLPNLAMVPRAMLPVEVALPDPSGHMFYDKRVADANDDWPKHRGYLRSQAAFFRYLAFGKR